MVWYVYLLFMLYSEALLIRLLCFHNRFWRARWVHLERRLFSTRLKSNVCNQ
jgi:hypothetical protein